MPLKGWVEGRERKCVMHNGKGSLSVRRKEAQTETGTPDLADCSPILTVEELGGMLSR